MHDYARREMPHLLEQLQKRTESADAVDGNRPVKLPGEMQLLPQDLHLQICLHLPASLALAQAHLAHGRGRLALEHGSQGRQPILGPLLHPPRMQPITRYDARMVLPHLLHRVPILFRCPVHCYPLHPSLPRRSDELRRLVQDAAVLQVAVDIEERHASCHALDSPHCTTAFIL